MLPGAAHARCTRGWPGRPGRGASVGPGCENGCTRRGDIGDDGVGGFAVLHGHLLQAVGKGAHCIGVGDVGGHRDHVGSVLLSASTPRKRTSLTVVVTDRTDYIGGVTLPQLLSDPRDERPRASGVERLSLDGLVHGIERRPAQLGDACWADAPQGRMAARPEVVGRGDVDHAAPLDSPVAHAMSSSAVS
jgi:hypothetical protein